jgi:hypothetical protein
MFLIHGVAYIREKMIIVDQEARQNAAKAFLAALRDDWKPKIRTVKPPPPMRNELSRSLRSRKRPTKNALKLALN